MNLEKDFILERRIRDVTEIQRIVKSGRYRRERVGLVAGPHNDLPEIWPMYNFRAGLGRWRLGGFSAAAKFATDSTYHQHSRIYM
jgi:hypothetical protein